MVKEEMDLSFLSSDQLIWSMIMLLNRMHDVGGVSCGRAARSTCLEIALSYGRHYKILDGLEDSSAFTAEMWDFVEVAKKKPTPSQLPLFGELAPCYATDRQLVEMAIYEMGQWYDEDQKRIDAIASFEYELAKMIVRLLTPHFKPVYQFPEDKYRELHIAWSDREHEWSDATLWSRYQALRET